MNVGTPVLMVLAKAFPPSLGGVETYSEQIVRAYMRSGLDVVVLSQTEGVAGWTTRRVPEGTFELWNAGPGNQAHVFRRMVQQAVRVRRKFEVRAVHSTTWRVGVVGQLVFPKVPRVVSVHGREVLNYPRGTRPIMQKVLRSADQVLCVSGATRSIVLRAAQPVDTSAVVVEFNGLTDMVNDCTPAIRDDDGCVRLLSLCRLVPRKNIPRAVSALATLDRDLLAKVEFKIAGRGPQFDAIKAEVERHSLADIVKVIGYVDESEIPELYSEADIFVHPHSHVGEGDDFEGFGIAIADAMAHGCAVISGKDGGPAEFVADEVTGLIVDGESVTEIAAALRILISDAALRRRLARSGQRYATENFSWDRHIASARLLVEPAMEWAS